MSESFGQIQAVANDVAHPLKIFEHVRREITDAKTADQVNRIVALATGLAAAARKATDREMEAEAEVLKLEAERRLGQLMQAQRETVGLNVGTRGSRTKGARVSEKPTLAEAGIDKNTAHRARRAAAMPEATFRQAAEAKREAVLTRSKRTRVKKGAPAADIALNAFNERVLDLVQRISNHAPTRFVKTSVPVSGLAKVAKFFSGLASLKSEDAAASDARLDAATAAESGRAP
jgi:hypothetical protein